MRWHEIALCIVVSIPIPVMAMQDIFAMPLFPDFVSTEKAFPRREVPVVGAER